jgi:hypothetical protein
MNAHDASGGAANDASKLLPRTALLSLEAYSHVGVVAERLVA